MKNLIVILFLFNISIAGAQKLKPGFDRDEYAELLKATASQSDTPLVSKHFPLPDHLKLLYRSPEFGLYNRWDLWLRDDSVAVISVRGTVNKVTSWLENFYAPLTSANGSFKLNDSTTFNYHLAENPRAAVHAGWLLGLSEIGPDVLKQITALNKRSRISEFLIVGHSQGGAIAYLLTSYLHYIVEAKQLPESFRFKTYCSAAPKPGNLYYAYDFEHITANGYGYVIINTSDWVPECPMTVQTFDDFNNPNPFAQIPSALKQQKLAVRLYGKLVYNKINRSTRKAQKRFDKYLGHRMNTIVKQNIPQYKEPPYAGTSNYMRAGIPVILVPDAEYGKKYPDDNTKIFMHHMFWPYYSLLIRNNY